MDERDSMRLPEPSGWTWKRGPVAQVMGLRARVLQLADSRQASRAGWLDPKEGALSGWVWANPTTHQTGFESLL
nr:hypothetical protein Iba_chr02aCG12240 [Ipomoea batatas]